MSMTGSPRRNSDRPLSKCCCRARSPLKNGAIEIGMIDIMSQKTAMWQMERSGPVQPSPQCRREGWPKGRCPPVVPGGYMRFLIAIVAAALTGGGATLAVAQHASVTGDLKRALAGLAEVTAQCVGCHAGYRLR